MASELQAQGPGPLLPGCALPSFSSRRQPCCVPNPHQPCGQSLERRLASVAPLRLLPRHCGKEPGGPGQARAAGCPPSPCVGDLSPPLPGHWAPDGPSLPASPREQAGLGRAPPVQSLVQLPPTDGPPWAGVTRPLGEAMPGPPFTALAEPWGPPEARARDLRCGLWAEGSGLPAQPGPRRAPCSSQGRRRLAPHEPRPPPAQHSHC